jgi:hypothetical protein
MRRKTDSQLAGACRYMALMALAIVMAGCAVGGSAAPVPTQTRVATPRPSPTPTPAAVSWLRGSTLLTIYGRGFGIVPVLGRLGYDNGFSDMERQIQPFVQGVRANNGGKRVLIGVHLIYAIATGCGPKDNCLAYLDDGTDIVKTYIQPAAKRGWLVVLDDQLGLSSPQTEVRRIIAKGYLRYGNVGVALDPEFRARPGQQTPGIPVGTVDASEINQAQALLDGYARAMHLRHHIVLVVHQFQPPMISRRDALRSDFPMVDLTVIADGFGPPDAKAQVYSDMLATPISRNIRWRGIKLFYPNPDEHAGHGDNPVMGWDAVFGKVGFLEANGVRYFVRPPPDIVVIA